jgi:hypothetical protein
MTEYIVYTFAENSTSITNHGGGGSGYNGYSPSDLYHLNGNGNGYSYYGDMSGSNYISIPGGSYNNTILNHSWEMGFYVNASSPQYAKLWDAACGAFSIQIHSGYVEVIRVTAGGGEWWWTCQTTPMYPGHDYYVTVAVAMPSNAGSCATSNVHVHIATDQGSPVHQAISFGGSGSGNWHDSSGTKYLNQYSCSLGSYDFNCSWFVYREFDSAVNWDNASDWSADIVRWTPPAAKVNTSVSCSPSTTTPLIGANYTISGRLTRSDNGAGIPSIPLNIFYSTDSEGTWQVAYSYCTTDGSGNYSYTQTGMAAPGEYEYVSFPGNGSYNGCNSGAIHVTGQAAPPPNYYTTLSCYVDNANPQDNTTITFYGYLLTTGGVGVNGGLVSLYLQGYTQGQAYTNSSGYYYIQISAVDGTNTYNTGFAQQTINGSIYYASSSGYVYVTGSAGIVDQTVTLTVIGIESKPNAVLFSDIGAPVVIQPECAPINPSINIGIYPTVVAAECAPVITDFPPANVYPDILGQFEFCFPPGVQLEAAARSMAVSQLSTQVLPPVVQPEAFTSNYCPLDISEDAPVSIIGTEVAVMNHYAVIDYPEVLEVDAVLEETLEASAQLTDAVHLGVTITKDIELVLEVTTE